MNAKNLSLDPVSDDEKRSAINTVLRKYAARLGVNPDLLGVKISFGISGGASPEREHELAKAKGLQMAFQSIEEILPNIRTRKDLDEMVQAFGELIEQAPTIARTTIDQIKAQIPRRGGPGRIPKLDFQESTVVCKEILKLVGRKYKVKDACVEVSKMCPDLLQKTVSPRTLQKTWDKRDEFLSD
jgi:hypothetical protein